MKVISLADIKEQHIEYEKFVGWIDYPLRHREDFIFPTKGRMNMEGSDYLNTMPCALPDENVMGVKLINRNEKRRLNGLNLDSQILLYSYDKCELRAVMDGNYITTVRTAAVAVHTIMNMVDEFQVVSMIGLGNIMNAIGEMWFPMFDRPVVIRVMNYKDQASNYIRRFQKYSNITFEVCNSYEELMDRAELVISAVSYTENDFCEPELYKKGCTIIPIHLRGFMECDRSFDNIVVSDMVRAKGFKYYDLMKKVTYTDDILNGSKKVRDNPDDRVIVYNLGLAITDIWFAHKLYNELQNCIDDIELGTSDKFYI